MAAEGFAPIPNRSGERTGQIRALLTRSTGGLAVKLELGPEKAMCGSAGHSQRAQRNMCILPFTTTMLCH
eukprot:scaffold328564_cov130-Tisochrysis_lutea.AAC.1